MANLDALRAAYQTQIDKLTDQFITANAAVLLDEFIALKTSAASLQGQSLESYSVAQRSITRRKIGDAESAANQKQVELRRCIFGMTGTMFVEMPEGLTV